MTGRTTWTVAVLGAAAALTLAACGGSSGGHPTNLSSLAGKGTGAPTGTQTAVATSTLGAPGKPGTKSSGSSSTAAGGHSSSTAAGGGSGGGGGGGNGGGGSGGGGGGGGGGSHSTAPSSNCVSSDTAGASIKVCPATGLHDGDTVTITGHGFTPDNHGLVKIVNCNGQYTSRCLVYTECYYPSSSAGSYGGNSNYCLSNTLSLTTQSNSSGDVGPLKLQVSQNIRGKYDCTKVQCIVAVSPPDPNPPTTDDPHVVIKFG